MAAENEIADLVIKLRADVSALTASMQVAKDTVQTKNKEIKDSFKELGVVLGEVFTIENCQSFYEVIQGTKTESAPSRGTVIKQKLPLVAS